MSQIVVANTSAITGDVSQFTVDNGTSPVVPTAGGNINVPDSSTIQITGSANTLTFATQAEIANLNTATTVGATTETCGTVTIPANSAAIINILVVGGDDADFAQNIIGNLVVQAWNVGAGAKKGQDLLVGGGKTAPAAVDFTVDTNADDIRLRVTGVAGSTYEWKSYIRYQIVS